MLANQNLEVWLRGPLVNVPALLQPVAHALLQAREEVNSIMRDFPENLIWERPAQVASVGFHLQHLTGVLDRLFTYARQEQLNESQLAQLAQEGKSINFESLLPPLIQGFNTQVDLAITELQNIDAGTLLDYRAVGRAQLPSTVLGLYVHAAEHTQRHVGQLLVTVKIVKALQQMNLNLNETV